MAKKTRRVEKVQEPAESRSGGKSLVIVESPAKAKTINKYLGNNYVVRASRGHVRDLPPHRYGVDPGRNFEPVYEVLPSHQKTVDELKKLAGDADTVYLATDLDREGEAIAWHLAQALELAPGKARRVIFNEITKSAIVEAFKHPHEINQAKVDAQQARRILDRVVGYELSPLLWKKVAKGLSAGRVQSVAVRLIVNREQEIAAFEPQEYWAIDAVFSSGGDAARLAQEWHTFLKGRKGAEPPSAKDRMAWLGDQGCFAAELVEFKSEPFKAEGRLTAASGKTHTFESAVDRVRPIAEALGFRVDEVKRDAWDQYTRLGLEQIELVGTTVPAEAPSFVVRSIETKRTRTRPQPPFTTATLQQAAANQLHFATSRTMKIAQALYEGVDIKTGEGPVGLITYMRTDSTALSAESVSAVRGLIGAKFGDRYLPDKPNRYESGKAAQEAHEAIRPTDVSRSPDALKGHLSPEQHKLYTLIWNRFVACQMTPAEWDSTTALISTKTRLGEAVFKATGRILAFDGFYKVLGIPKSSEDQLLPALKEGQKVDPLSIEPKQKFTAPPPRYTEASLVKTLEAEGIGRPSTYAAIIKTIQDRGYVEQIDRRFHPTPRGTIVTDKLCAHFPKIMDIRFTSHIEEDLDKIEEKEMEWHDVLHEFYDPFKESLAKAHEEMDAVRAEPSEYTCTACGKPMVYRFGKNGRFLSCTGYPDCKETRNVDRDGKPIEPVVGAEPCETCGKPMIVRKSRTGLFLGCSGYPDCSNTKPCDDSGVALRKVRAEDIHEKCPDCGAPMSVKWARGRAFLGCNRFPECKATAPMPEGVYVEKPKPEEAGARCDKCGRAMVIRKSRRGPFLSCSGFPRCRNAMPMDKLDELKRKEAAGEIPDAPAEAKSNGAVRSARTRSAGGKAKRLTKEELAALGPAPTGFAWTLTGRPVVEVWPDGSLKCFECGGEMTLRNGRFGPFFSCGKCRAVANLRGEAKKRAEAEAPREERAKPIETEVKCPDCNSKMLLRMGRTGRFLGCSAYPKCKKTMEVPPGLLREVAETAGV
ncbi:MAG: type I DNA topoisomerase [Planctomycetota bacterium]|nr:MAG: type I DNA topoisomerase [Planctomycetota bacterium]